MTKYLRYAMATLCFAASVGCLTLWWRSEIRRDQVTGQSFFSPSNAIGITSAMGMCIARTIAGQHVGGNGWTYTTSSVTESERDFRERFVKANGYFTSMRYGGSGIAVYFPLWYPSLIFALAGVGVLKIRLQFSIRSALICVSVVAALLGMAVIL